MKKKFIFSAALSFLVLSNSIVLGQGEDNPTSVSGIYNGNITTAGNYDPFTQNALRIVDDIVVPGSVGAYPLKWTRYYNSRKGSIYTGWSFSYNDYLAGETGTTLGVPDGRLITFGDCNQGVEENLGYWTDANQQQWWTGFLADGGKVLFQGISAYSAPYFYYQPAKLIDPYGQVTTMTYAVAYTNINGDPIYQLDRVTEPGGRYLQLFWTPSSIAVPDRRITRVEAHDAQGNLTQWVNYSYTQWQSGSEPWTLTGVAYADGTSAAYTWVAGGPSSSVRL